MKSLLSSENIQKILKLAGLYHVLVGFFLLFFPSVMIHFLSFETLYTPEIWQCVGATTLIFGVGYFVAALGPEDHWLIVFVGLFSKLLVSLLLVRFCFYESVAVTGYRIIFLHHFFWILPFISILLFVYEARTLEESAPKRFHDLIRYVKASNGVTLFDLSEKKNVLLVFVRHFGCTFCRETVSEIAKLDKSLEKRNLTPVFIHMSDPDFADEFFARYYALPVPHISDPSRLLYKSLNLKRGSFYQVFGPKTWLRGIWAGIFKGHGLGSLEGDALQLGALFILSKGQIVFEHKNLSASDVFDLDLLPHA
jgi:peroxiredoxin